nr:hypothetical protein L204_02969 [Cryptococcus depauperatus CBS 7855]
MATGCALPQEYAVYRQRRRYEALGAMTVGKRKIESLGGGGDDGEQGERYEKRGLSEVGRFLCRGVAMGVVTKVDGRVHGNRCDVPSRSNEKFGRKRPGPARKSDGMEQRCMLRKSSGVLVS